MIFDFDLPDEISDETAVVPDFLYALGDAIANRYYGQIRCYYQDQHQPPPPRDDDRQLSLFPELDIPF